MAIGCSELAETYIFSFHILLHDDLFALSRLLSARAVHRKIRVGFERKMSAFTSNAT